MEHQSIFLDVKLWYAVAFVLFFVLVGRKLYAAITGWLDGKITKIKTDIDEAARLRAEAETLLQQAKARHAAASREADELVAKANAEAEAVRARTNDETNRLIAQREQQVMARIAQAEKQALADIQAQTVQLALDMARAHMANLPADKATQLADAAITDIGKAA
jgi:F-type H+-transporting ATPase subunit b